MGRETFFFAGWTTFNGSSKFSLMACGLPPANQIIVFDSLQKSPFFVWNVGEMCHFNAGETTTKGNF